MIYFLFLDFKTECLFCPWYVRSSSQKWTVENHSWKCKTAKQGFEMLTVKSKYENLEQQNHEGFRIGL